MLIYCHLNWRFYRCAHQKAVLIYIAEIHIGNKYGTNSSFIRNFEAKAMCPISELIVLSLCDFSNFNYKYYFTVIYFYVILSYIKIIRMTSFDIFECVTECCANKKVVKKIDFY